MSAQEHVTGTTTDAVLLASARGGDTGAVSRLFERHQDEAVRFARGIAGEARAEDIVSESFLKVFRLLAAGGGPTDHFKAYLFTTIRRTSIDLHRRTGSEVSIPDEDLPVEVVRDGADERAEHALLLEAMQRLTPAHREVLWLGEVLSLPQKEIARRLSSNPNAIGALRYRAREALRQEYLAAHLATVVDPECRRVVDLLPRHVRGQLSAPQQATVDTHLERDDHECHRALRILTRENARLGAFLLPVLLAPAAGLWSGGGGSLVGVGDTLAGSAAHVAGGASSQARAAALAAVCATVAGVALTLYLASPPTDVSRDSGTPDAGRASATGSVAAGPAGAPSPAGPPGSASVWVPSAGVLAVTPGLVPTIAPSALDTTLLPPPGTATFVLVPPGPAPTPTSTPTSSETPTATPTPVPTATPTPTVAPSATRWAMAWSQVEPGTSLAGRVLTVSAEDGSSWSVSPSMELVGTEAQAFNFRVGNQGLPGPLAVQGMPPGAVAMVLNLRGTGSQARITLSFARPISGIEFDVYSLGLDDDAAGFREVVEFSQPMSASGNTESLTGEGVGPFMRTEHHLDGGPVRFAGSFATPQDRFTLTYTHDGPVGSNAWCYLAVGDLVLSTAP